MDHRGSICRTLAYIGAEMDHTLVIPALRELQATRPAAPAADARLVDQVGARRAGAPSRRGPILIAAALSLVAALAAGASSAALHAHARATASATPTTAATSSTEVDPAALARSAPSAVEPEVAAPPTRARGRGPSAAPSAPSASPAPSANDGREASAPDTAELDDEPSGGLVPAPAHLLEGALRGD